MKAWVYNQIGSPKDVLKLEDDVDVPQLKDNEVLLKVITTALNPVDYKHMLGFVKPEAPFPLAKHVFGSPKVGATSSTGKLELLKSLCVDLPIDYTQVNLDDLPEKFDVVFDTIGQVDNALKAAAEGGSVVTLLGALPPIISFIVTSNGSVLEKLNPFLENGQLKPLIDPKGPFPFSQTVEAFCHLATGKVVVCPIA